MTVDFLKQPNLTPATPEGHKFTFNMLLPHYSGLNAYSRSFLLAICLYALNINQHIRYSLRKTTDNIPIQLRSFSQGIIAYSIATVKLGKIIRQRKLDLQNLSIAPLVDVLSGQVSLQRPYIHLNDPNVVTLAMLVVWAIRLR